MVRLFFLNKCYVFFTTGFFSAHHLGQHSSWLDLQIGWQKGTRPDKMTGLDHWYGTHSVRGPAPGCPAAWGRSGKRGDEIVTGQKMGRCDSAHKRMANVTKKRGNPAIGPGLASPLSVSAKLQITNYK